MDRILYQNKYGKLVFGCGTYMLTNAEGINSPEVQRQTETVIDTDGQEIIQTYYPSKTITINGYIRAQNRKELSAFKKELVCFCDCKESGILFYEKGNKSYFTEVIPNSFPEFGDEIQYTVPFSVTFHAYNIYWKNSMETSGYVYERFPNVKTTFTLPCVFTVRKTKKVFYNMGDMPCDFICEITGVDESGEVILQSAGTDSKFGFSITNNNTGERMEIDHKIEIGETVRIDTKHFIISSSKYGNLLHKMQRNCDFFRLAPGKSEIEIINLSPENNISVHFQFNEMFLGV